MEMERITKDDSLEEIHTLFLQAVNDKETLFQPLDIENFRKIFLEEDENCKLVLVGKKEGKTIGFVAGNTCKGKKKGYITYIQIAAVERHKGYAEMLLHEMEQELQSINKTMEAFEIMFFNPSNLAWNIPNHEGADHPNIPGMDLQSPAHIFFKNNGYLDFAYENCYYLNLRDYSVPEAVRKLENVLKQKGIYITRYTKEQHDGFQELFDNLGNEDWRKQIMDNISCEDGGKPVLVAVKDGRICGFTGPLYVQESKRGYFAGIGVHSEYRGGTGTVLFAALCANLKEMGAEFMTLFTGENNPARGIYEKAGFRIVRSFACMRKVCYNLKITAR